MQIQKYAAPICLGLYGAITIGSSFAWNSAVSTAEAFGRLCPHDDYLHGPYSTPSCASLASSMYGQNITGFVIKLLGLAFVSYVLYDIHKPTIVPLNRGEALPLVNGEKR